MTLAVAVVLLAGACNGEDAATTSTGPTDPNGTVTLTYEFENGSDGWAAEVSDYTSATRPEDVVVATGVQPPGIADDSGFIHLAATNRSDDLFQFLLRQIGPEADLKPETAYRIAFDITGYSNAPSNCAGIGGAPGESVWLKVGASTVKPQPVDEDGSTRLNVDKGGQSEGGENAEVAGNLANGIPCEHALENNRPYEEVNWSESLPDSFFADQDGNIWLFVGIESGFEGRSDLYYDRVEVSLTPAESS